MDAETPDVEPRSLASRPESRTALAAGIAGGLFAAFISVKAILGSASSTAGIGFVFVPFIMVIAMVIAGIWGYAVACLWHAARGTSQHYAIVLVMAALIGLGLPAWGGWQVSQGLALERAVAETRTMSAAALVRAMDDSRWRTNRFFIGAVAQNPAADEALLDRIAMLADTLPEAELYEPLGSLWDVKLDNRKGLAAMRLVALNPNVGAATLARLAEGPHAGKVIAEVLRNPKTPMAVLSRHFATADPQAQWGLALNPTLPVDVMEKLSASSDRYIRFNLTYNPATPRTILEKLARDPDPTLATHAAQALERKSHQAAPAMTPQSK
jgi:hypothetical protein